MKLFARYFLHFFSVLFIFFLVLLVLLILDNTIKTSWLSIAFYFIAILIFVLPMTFFYSSNEKLANITIENDNQGKNIILIQEFIENETKRTECINQGKVTIYSMKNKYKKWLTNSISVLINKDKIEISIPRAYEKALEKKINYY